MPAVSWSCCGPAPRPPMIRPRPDRRTGSQDARHGSWSGDRPTERRASEKRRAMSVLLKSASIDAITIFTEDLDASRKFYLEVFGLPVMFEDESSAVFKFDNTIINVLRDSAAHELIEPGAVASQQAGARSVLTVGVDDVDEVCA